MEKAQLLDELKERFAIMKAELGFKSSLEDLNNIFFLDDFVIKTEFVSNRLSRQICSRIVETYMNWNNYLHSLIIANPQNMINVTESKVFNDEERVEIRKLMTKAMALVSTNTLVGLTKDRKAESKFIDDSVSFWVSEFGVKVEEIMRKVNDGWKERIAKS